MFTPIKYASHTYDLGIIYQSCANEIQSQINIALNSIDATSEVGKVLIGQNPYYTLHLTDANVTQSGTLEYVDIQLLQISGRTEPVIKVFPDGSYQKGNNQVKVLGSAVQVTASA